MRQQFQAGTKATALNAHESDIDSVGRSSAHDASDDHQASSLMGSAMAVVPVSFGVERRTASENSHTRRRHASTLDWLGTGANFARTAAERALKALTRLAFAAIDAANGSPRSACWRTASKARHTFSSFWHTRNMSEPACRVWTAASSIGTLFSTPPMSRSSEITSPL